MSNKSAIKDRRIELNLTLEEVAMKVGVTKATVQRWESGLIKNMKRDKIALLAQALNTTPIFILGLVNDPNIDNSPSNQIDDTNIVKYKKEQSPILTKKIPMLGEIACGQPIFANQEYNEYVEVGHGVKADFALTACGDSMIDANIKDGDIIFCTSQNTVNNGEIGVVIIGDEATLKRVYFDKNKQRLILQPENKKYEPMVYVGEELENIRIIGKAVALKLN